MVEDAEPRWHDEPGSDPNIHRKYIYLYFRKDAKPHRMDDKRRHREDGKKPAYKEGERESDVSERRCSDKAGASREGDNNEPRPKPRPHPP